MTSNRCDGVNAVRSKVDKKPPNLAVFPFNGRQAWKSPERLYMVELDSARVRGLCMTPRHLGEGSLGGRLKL